MSWEQTEICYYSGNSRLTDSLKLTMLAKPHFRFKQFSVWHDQCAMKVSTDGILLGAWASISNTTKKVLDIGTGTGLLSLMVSQRLQEHLQSDR